MRFDRCCSWYALLASCGLLLVGCGTAPVNEKPASAPVVNFRGNIAEIVFDRCLPCHREGQSAPFTLASYADVRQRGRQIAEVVESGYMPPWLPNSSSGQFANDRSLSATEIQAIRSWVDQGMPEGEHLPPTNPPSFSSSWLLGEPDLVVSMASPYHLAADGPDEYRNFVLSIPMERSRYVRAVDLQPGNPRIVHHAVMMIDRTRASRDQDEQDSAPGFAGMLTANARPPEGSFLGWTPGNLPEFDDPRLAWRLDPGTDLVLQTHLQRSGKQESLTARVGFYFSDQPPTRTAALVRIGKRNLDIPAGNACYEMTDEFSIPVDATLLSVYPHAHYLAREMHGWAIMPNGEQRSLIRIDNWDVNWQDNYRFAHPIRLPRGSRLAMRFTYDNSAENVRNPNHPPQRVTIGPAATDEMGDFLFRVVPDRPIDIGPLKTAIARKDIHEDLNLYQTLVRAYPNVAIYHNDLGLRYRNLGQLGQARSHLMRAVQLDPNDYLALANLGGVLAANRDLEGAENRLRRALELAPDNPSVLNNLGLILCQRRKTTEALPLFHKALDQAPDYPMAHFNLGLALASMGKHARAIEHFETVLRLRPELVQARTQIEKIRRRASRREP